MPLLRDVAFRPGAWPPPRDREAALAALAYARQRDPWGHRVHTAFAALYLFLVPVAPAPRDGAFILLLAYSLARLHCTLPALSCLLRDRLMWVLFALTGWLAVSISWGDDPAEGFEKLRAFRVLLTPLLIWPVIDRLPWLVGAFLAGVVAQNGVQLCQGLRWFGLRPAGNRRLDGLLHAIELGTMCMAAICWHLSAMIRGRGWLRWISAAGLLTAAAGLLYSGSRGPWIGLAAAVGVFVPVTAWRRPALRRPMLVVSVVAVLAVSVIGVLGKDMIVRRWHGAWADLEAARAGNLETDVGRRLALWEGAWRVYLHAPVVGVGLVGLENAVKEVYGDIGAVHCHSTYLDVMATTGSIGGGLLLGSLALLLVRTFRDHDDTPWSLGTPFVLVGWLVAGQFDAYHLNGHTFGLIGLLVAMTLPWRPVMKGMIRG